MNSESRILAARLDGVVWLRIKGKGSFQNSPDLKNYAQDRLEAGETTLVIDLEDCITMDSTFMGTLTGIALEMLNRGEGTVHVINANTRTLQLLQNLGLDNILSVDTDGSAWKSQRALVSRIFSHGDAELPHEPLERAEQAEHVLGAHEALLAAHDANVPRFRDVVEFLRQDVEKHRS